ncbi:exopolyphosphatase [Malassezia caprae]|uniref:Exopolyphosphatase n=1 Tax=Malassezia caprae TaxID=1381934 RepID=A0AAF0IXD1_9BASI|nr:exopolyphosphatase [Malassezia caprae]
MDAFLAKRQAQASRTHLVVGNEAGDLDSVACAIAYAYLHQASDDAQWVPIVQTPRADLVLRPENLRVLAHCGIDPAHLCCVDELPQPLPASTCVVLVDHNRATGLFRDAKVVRILDHHNDECAHGDAQRTVYMPGDAGSCASVLTTHLLERPEAVDRAVADLLYSAILVDTLGLSAHVGKAQKCDYAARDLLAPASSWADEAAAHAWHDTLQHAKNDVSHLTTSEKLRRDYKAIECAARNAPRTWHIGTASTTEPVPAWSHTPRFYADLDAFARARSLHALLILASYEVPGDEHPALVREVLFYVPETGITSGAPALAEALAATHTHHVDLVPLDAAAPSQGWA